MKIVELKGGLGNQMFQYAVARASESDKNTTIFLDLSYLNQNSVSTDSHTARLYELGIFNNLRADILSNYYCKLIHSKGLIIKIYRNLIFFNPKKIKQKENEFVNIPVAKNIFFDGFFQSEKYFKSQRKEILSDFQFPELDETNGKIEKQILQENSVSIHIRRGDYVTVKQSNDYHGTIQTDYYKQAIHKLNDSDTDLSYYIFSDDLEYARQHFSNLPNATFVLGNTAQNSWKDMRLMSSCKHHIIANSSFSWWGAWLSERGGTTIAPKQWFAQSVTFDINDFIPSQWRLL